MIQKRKFKKQSLLGGIINWVLKKIPVISSFFVFFLSFVFFKDSSYFAIQAQLVLIPIFYWSIKTPEKFSFLYIIMIAFFQDIMDGVAFGSSLFLFLSLHFAIIYQKFLPLAYSFSLSYLTFAVTMLILILIKSFIFINLYGINISISNVLLSLLILCLYYPIFYYILDKLNEKIVKRTD